MIDQHRIEDQLRRQGARLRETAPAHLIDRLAPVADAGPAGSAFDGLACRDSALGGTALGRAALRSGVVSTPGRRVRSLSALAAAIALVVGLGALLIHRSTAVHAPQARPTASEALSRTLTALPRTARSMADTSTRGLREPLSLLSRVSRAGS